MRNLTLIFAFLFIGWSVSASVNSKTAYNSYSYNYNDSFIFIEGGVEFAVYPNGEFDFYFNPDFRRGTNVHFGSPNVNISYNSGYNYDPFVQYDDYGAVIQIENIPIYYDYYGRIIQAGNVFMTYNNFGYLASVGSMRLHYNRHRHFTHYTGFINHYNPHYIHRPWHRYYRRPHVNVSIVFNRPYRAYYVPQRISYNQYVTVYNNYYAHNNGRRNFYRPADRVRSYNYGKKLNHKRDIAHINARRDNSIANSRQQVARDRAYKERVNNRNYSDSKRMQSNLPARSENRAVVRGRQSERSSTYSDSGRIERSSDAQGRSARFERPTTNRNVTRDNSKVRGIERNVGVKRDRENIQRSPTQSRMENPQRPVNRNVQSSMNKNERNSVNIRQTRQRSSAVRKSAPVQNRSGATQKKSSRTRSSARNMN